MQRLLRTIQSHLNVTRNEALFVAASAAIVVSGSIASRILPLGEVSRLHDHTSVETVLKILDSLEHSTSSKSSPEQEAGQPDTNLKGVEQTFSPSKNHGTPMRGALPININKASASDLESVPGIGPAMAQRIIEHRRTRPFKSVEDLLDVKGIGLKTLEKLRPYISVP